MRALNKLTAQEVANLDEPGRYADGGGLYLQVSKPDDDQERVTKSWLFRFMLDGRARQMGLGSVATFSLAQARERARLARQQVADKLDPIESRLKERDDRRAEEAARITFKEAAAKFLALHEDGWRNEKHKQQWPKTLAAYAFPSLGSRPVSAIDAALINHTLAPIWKTKAETASRVKQRIERIVQWVKDGMPLPAVGKAARVKHHNAIHYSELPAFMAELRGRDSISARALEFTILNASRTGETIGARWDEIDLTNATWTIPAERMKAKKDHRVPLTERAIEILKSAPREKDNPHIFVGASNGRPIPKGAMLELLRGMSGNGYTVHGFRSTFKDWARERTNYPREVAETALAHVLKDKVEAAYARGDMLEKRRPLMRDWAKFCAQKPVAESADVIALHPARA